ncbi:hypothetical protein [uncultured Algoriphagus sp.]|uniref:hypothetical protein n=1 Tax=uncultured Algoriphagus sp. TaxID=417365 RepID=UPI002587CBE7|nr:hypothetical protein [uncultured Algoriphagus sp.]
MKKILKILAVLAFSSCNERFPYEIGRFPEENPINLLEMNTIYDEMNSDFVPPVANLRLNFKFSSNSSSMGSHFDLEPRGIDFLWDKRQGSFSCRVFESFGDARILKNLLREINSPCDEKGPYFLSFHITLYSIGCDGKFKIFLNEFQDNGIIEGYTSKTTSLKLIGGDSNEMYPTFYGGNFKKGAGVESQGRPEKMLFSSDRDGTFDIYEVDLPASGSVLEYLQSSEEKEIQKIGINTNANDHMPFVYGDLLVFSSDRPGGYGGYDLYYSFRSGDGWTEPENFGPKINSEFDEYRPVVSDSWEFENQVMIFSSNRPGGLGGFDLYFVGIPKF